MCGEVVVFELCELLRVYDCVVGWFVGVDKLFVFGVVEYFVDLFFLCLLCCIG